MKTKHFSTRKKMMLSSLAMLLISALTMSMATYAWFTMSREVSVSSIEFSAQAASGIQISADGKSWKSSLTAADLEAITANVKPSALVPSSTVNAATAGALNFFTVNSETGEVTAAEAVAKDQEGAYYKFDFYVLNQMGEAKDLQLNLAANGGSTVAAGAQNAKGTQNSVRVAFIQQDSQTTLTALIGTGSSANIWEPNATAHTDFATRTRLVTGNDGLVAAGAVDYVRNGIAYKYVGLKAVATGADLSTGAVNDADSTGLVTTTTGDTNMTLGNMGKDCITKYTCYIWIEGQDVDCANDVAGGSIKVDLKFVVPESTVQP